MATDATGTPSTHFEFPKYDVDNDAPSGLGLNAIVDDIDSKIKSKVPNHLITSLATNDVPVWNGTTWVRPTGTASASTYLRGDGSWATISVPSSTITVGTSLPGSPSDGDKYILVDSTTAPTYSWLFQYSTGVSDSNKWIFLGGAPASSENTTATTGETSGTYKDPTNGTASITVPRAGVYEIHYGANLNGQDAGGAIASIKLGIAATSDDDAIRGDNNEASARQLRKTLAASDVVKIQHKNAGATSAAIDDMWLKIIPVRVA